MEKTPLRRDQYRNHPLALRLGVDALQRYASRRAGYWLRSMTELASYLDIPEDRAFKWSQRGLSITAAEETAAGLGCHPWDIWGDTYWGMTGADL